MRSTSLLKGELFFGVRMMATLKSKLRGSIMSSHGVRKNTRNNLWLSYSQKLGLDLSLASNSELIYWLSDLEAEPTVRNFAFGHMAKVKIDSNVAKYRNVDLIKVELTDGTEEFHHISGEVGNLRRVSITFCNEFGIDQQGTYVQISKEYLATKSRRASRLLTVNAFASQLRGNDWEHEIVEVGNVIKILKRGTVEKILALCPLMDPMIALGIFSKMALAGYITLDLRDQSFGRHSSWSLP